MVGFLKSALETDAACVKREVASEEMKENIKMIAGSGAQWPCDLFMRHSLFLASKALVLSLI